MHHLVTTFRLPSQPQSAFRHINMDASLSFGEAVALLSRLDLWESSSEERQRHLSANSSVPLLQSGCLIVVALQARRCRDPVLMMASHHQLDQLLSRVPFLPLHYSSHPQYLIAHSNLHFHHQFQSQAQLRPTRSTQYLEVPWVRIRKIS